MKALSSPAPQCRLLVLQATPFCNIDCSYCYLANRSSKRRMSLDTVAAAFKRVFESGWYGRELTVAWHAGEPLAAGISFYKEATRVLNHAVTADIDLKQGFQTNATLVSPEWCKFFKSVGAEVGVSIDGPKFLHDRNRVFRNGSGTFEKTIAGLRLLRDARIPLQVLTVLTLDSLQRPEELYDFYISEGIDRVAFNIEEIEGANTSSSLSGPAAAELYEEFLSRFATLNSNGLIKYVRELDDMVCRIDAPPDARIVNLLVEPFAIVNVKHDGDFSTFCPELLDAAAPDYCDFIIGNVHTTTFREARSSLALLNLHQSIQSGVAKCEAECEYFSVCGGGAPANKWFEAGRFETTETLQCRLNIKAVANVALDMVERREATNAALS